MFGCKLVYETISCTHDWHVSGLKITWTAKEGTQPLNLCAQPGEKITFYWDSTYHNVEQVKEVGGWQVGGITIGKGSDLLVSLLGFLCLWTCQLYGVQGFLCWPRRPPLHHPWYPGGILLRLWGRHIHHRTSGILCQPVPKHLFKYIPQQGSHLKRTGHFFVFYILKE